MKIGTCLGFKIVSRNQTFIVKVEFTHFNVHVFAINLSRFIANVEWELYIFLEFNLFVQWLNNLT